MQSSDFLLHNLEVQLDVKRVLTCVIKITFVSNSTAMNMTFFCYLWDLLLKQVQEFIRQWSLLLEFRIFYSLNGILYLFV